MKDGGPAFPAENYYPPEGGPIISHPGMSLRDWFAGMATDKDVEMAAQDLMKRFKKEVCSPSQARFYHADAMLAAREKP